MKEIDEFPEECQIKEQIGLNENMKFVIEK